MEYAVEEAVLEVGERIGQPLQSTVRDEDSAGREGEVTKDLFRKQSK